MSDTSKHCQASIIAVIACFFVITAAKAAASTADQLTAQILRTVDLRDWTRAHHLASLHPLPAMPDLVAWLEMRDDPNGAEDSELEALLKRRADWPGLATLRRSFEQRIAERLPLDRRVAYFEQYPPRSRDGRLILADSLIEAGLDQRARDLVRRIWVEDNFDAGDARYFLRIYQDMLTDDDHQARLTRLLWDRRTNEATRMLKMVGADQRALATARIRLQRKARNVDAAIRAIPRHLKGDPGLAFDRMRWRVRMRRHRSAREILEDPPKDLGVPERWWPSQHRAIRDLYDDGKLKAARALAAKHGQRTGSALAEAAWLAGWLDLKAGDAAGAEAEFLTLFEHVKTPISKARAAYWLARTHALASNIEERDRWIDQAVRHPATFYGQEAARLGNRPFLLPTLRGMDAAGASNDGDDRAALALSLCSTGERAISERFIKAIGYREIAEDVGTKLRSIALARQCKRPDLVIELGKRYARSGTVPVDLAFPLPTIQPSDPTLAPWSFAIMRQESHMDPAAESPAGARGLMQLIPSTAKRVSRQRGEMFGRRRLVSDIHYNIGLGTEYFAGLLARYRGEPALALAAYNAGPSRVRTWLRRYGDPRGKPREAWIDWIESIPFAETRNYVQRVIEAQKVYASLIANRNGLMVDLNAPTGPRTLLPPKRRPDINRS